MDYFDIACGIMRYLPSDYRGVAARYSKVWYCAFVRSEPDLHEIAGVGNVASVYLYGPMCDQVGTADGAVRGYTQRDLIVIAVNDAKISFYTGKHRVVDKQIKIAGFWTLEMWFDRLVAECRRRNVTPRTVKAILACFCHGGGMIKHTRVYTLPRAQKNTLTPALA